MSHTPGPWTVQGQAVLSDRPYPEWKQIAEVRIGNADNWSDPEGESNARLIAAAPELLAALRAARDDLSDLLEVADLTDEGVADTTAVLNQVIAAIATAEGRSTDNAVS